MLRYCFLTTLPLFLHSLTPLVISNCLNLPFGTQRWSRRPKAFFLQTRNGGHKKSFGLRKAPQGPTQFQSPFFLTLLNFDRNGYWTRNGIWFGQKGLLNLAEELNFCLVGGLSFKCTECDSQEEVRTISQLFNINKSGGF